MKYGFLFGAGAEVSYGLPSGGKFALDIFRFDTSSSKKAFKDMRDGVDPTTDYASYWLPTGFMEKNISSFGKTVFQNIIKDTVEHNRDNIIRCINRFDEVAKKEAESMVKDGINIDEVFKNLLGKDVSNIHMGQSIKFIDELNQGNELFDSSYYSALLMVYKKKNYDLYMICNEVFGAANFESCVAWRRRTNQPNDKSKMIAKVAEYILVYAKSSSYLSESKGFYGVPLTSERKNEYKNPDNDHRGPWSSNPWKAAVGRGGTKYSITTPTGITYTETWYGTRETFNALIADKRVHWTDGGNGYPRIKIYLSDAEKEGQAAINFFTPDRYGSNQEGSSTLQSLMEVKGLFDNPKPTTLLNALMRLSMHDDSIVLDFFSGSATTAHAVMQLNAEDGGHRKFIMVQLPEPCDEKSEAYKAGYPNICEIGKERIRRAAKKIAEENPDKPFDGGFRVFKLADTNMTDVFYSAGEYTQDLLSQLESNIKPDRTDLDLLFGCLLEWGLPLSMPYTSEQIKDCTVHTYNDGDLIACFDENIPDTVIKEIAKRRPLRAVFRDSSFADSPAKINVGEIFKLLAPDTRVKVL